MRFYKKYKTEILVVVFWTIQFFIMKSYLQRPEMSSTIPDVQVFISAGGDTLRYHAKAQEIYILPRRTNDSR